MNKLFVLVVLLLSGVVNAGKMHTLDVEVRASESQALLPGIKLMIRVDGEEQVRYTNASGSFTLTWKGNLKSISINAYDTSGVYRYAHEFIEKKELKAEQIKRVLYMQSRPNYDVLFADFRKIDETKRLENIANGSDTKVYEGEDDCPDLKVNDFAQGVDEMRQWIAKNVQYPYESIERNEQGRVYMSFIIEQDGTITNVNIDRGVSDALDYESARLMYSMPKWTPSTCNGVPVRTLGRMPISFTLN